MKNNSISVAIITFNRSNFLRKNVPTVLRQLKSGDELLIVDNNSTDNTQEFVKSINDPRVRVIFEKTQGLNHGRNAAIKNAENFFVLLLDDDARPASNWLSAYREALGKFPDVAIFAGKTLNDYVGSDKPVYLAEKYEYLLGKKDYGVEYRFLKKSESPGGGNMMVNKNIILKYGGFDPGFDRNGELLIGNGEKELFNRINATEKCLYVPKGVIYHYAPKSRSTREHLLLRMYWQGYSDALLAKKNHQLLEYRMKRIFFYPSKFFFECIKRTVLEPKTIGFSFQMENAKTRGVYNVH